MADGIEVGRAHVTVTADGKGAARQVETDFRKQMPAVGKKAGGHLGAGLFAAAKGFAAPIAALFALDKIGGFFKGANAEAREAQKVGALTTQVIKSTGGAAKVTAKDVGNLATAISKKTGIDDEQIQSSANMLLTFKNIHNETGKGNKIFDQATRTVTDMSAALGQSGKSSAIQLGKALNDPIKGITALTRVGVTFTAGQKKQIAEMVKSGDTLGAQKVILKELNSEFGGAAAASATAGDKMRVAWGNFTEDVGTALMPVIDAAANLITTTLIPALSGVVSFLSTRVAPVLKLVVLGVRAFFAAFKEGDVTSNGLVGLFERAGVAARGLVQAFRGLSAGGGGGVMSTIRSIAATVVANLLPAFRAVAGFIVTQVVPAFLSIVGAVRQWYAVIIPIVLQIVGVIVSKFQQMRPQILSIWTSVKEIITGVMFIVREVISSVTHIVQMIWARWGNQIKAVVSTVFGAVVTIISGVMKAVAGIIKLVVALIKGDWRGAWNAIKQIFAGVWQAIKGILTLATAALRATLTAWLNKVRSLWTSATTAVRNTWNSFWTAIRNATSTAINAVLDKVRTVLDRIKNAFSTAKDNIRRIWDGLKDVVSKPVRWVVDHVYNSPLVPVWNRVAGLVNGPKLSAYARGGVEPYGVRPGYTPGRDTHIIRVGGGEAIMRPEFTRAVGKDWIYGANAAARRGGISGARQFAQSRMPGFAGGGVVGWLKGIASSVGGTVGNLASKLKDWVLGGLRDAAGKVLSPVKNLIDRAMPSSGVGSTVGGVGKKAIDLVLDKIKSADAAAMAALSPGQGAYTGPPGTGSRRVVTWHGGHFTERFRNTLEQAQKIAGTFINVIQGGFRPATSYSGTSHRGDAIDTSWRASVLSGLRRAGVAAWHRTPAQGFAHHIHGVPLPGRGYPGGSGIWQAQDYLRGGNGLANGGIARPGWSVVGERGRELVNFGRGGQRVYSNHDSNRMLGGVTITGGQFGYSPEEIADAILKKQRQHQALNPVF